METLIVKGNYSTFRSYESTFSTNNTDEKVRNIPIELKRNIEEDACWSNAKMPGLLIDYFTNDSLFINSISSININELDYEKHFARFKNDSISDSSAKEAFNLYKQQRIGLINEYRSNNNGAFPSENDVIQRSIGEPTHPIVKALLYAEYQKDVSLEIAKAHGIKGIVEHHTAPDFLPEYNPYAPYSPNNVSYMPVRRKPLIELDDEALLKIMFDPFRKYASSYAKDLEDRFRAKDGNSLIHDWAKWPIRITTNMYSLLYAIRGKIYLGYKNNSTQDITSEIENNMIKFTNPINLQEAMAFGGIQALELNGYLTKVLIQGSLVDSSNILKNNLYVPTILEVRLEFILKDWFGVDEQDVYNNRLAAQLGREALAAFWVLQHMRGFRPFMNVIKYKEKTHYTF